MKTIVARFTEMKKSPNSIIEVEGETVDVNKVETALRSAGVAARDTSGQFRDVDDVLLELSSKWDSLDVMTQRYIATTAAGSRQQSRFIAMMSNYQRTLELTSYAQNSAGASQKQFEKTTESLESKLNKLHNAWEQLITGIGNQTAIKGVVDLLTGLITTINNVTSAIDPLKTGWSKLLTVILGFKATKGIANSALQNIGAALSKGKDGKATALSEKVRKKFERTKSSSSTSSEERKNLEIKKAGTKEAKKQLEEEELILRKKQAQRRAAEDKLKDEKQITEELKKQKANNNKELDSLNGKLTGKQKKRQTILERDNKAIDRKLASKTGKGGAISNAERSVSSTAAEEAAQLQKIKKAHEDVANAEKAEQVAADALYKSNKLGLATKIRYNLQLVFGTKKAKEHARETLIEAGAVTAEGKATEGAGISQWALNASMLACPVMWLVAGIAAVVAAIAIFNAIYETAEERAENLSKATEELTNQMNETQQTIGDLKDSWESLTSLKSELGKLTVGTTEWKSKLLEVNQEVINLIDKIPELAQYLTKGENGELSISTAGYEKVLDIQQENLLRQQKASLLNQALQAEANQEVYVNKDDNDKAATSEISKENFLATSVSQFADDYAVHQEKIGKKLSEQEKIFVKQALSNKKTLTNFEELRAQTSVDVDEYARLTGLTVEQVKQKREQNELSDDTIRSLIATNKYQVQFENNAKNLLKMRQSGQITDFAERAIKGTNNFTIKDIQEIISKNNTNTNKIKDGINKEFAENGIVNIGDDEDKKIKARKFITDNLNIDQKTLANLEASGISLDSILQNLLNSINSFNQNSESLENFDVKSQKSITNLKNSITKALGEDLTAEQENQISSLFSKVADQGGDISEVSKIFEDMIPKLKNADDVEKFVQELNNVDFSSETKIRTFSDNLKDFGIILSEKVKNQLVSATNAAKDFSMQKVVDELRSQELGETVQEHIKNNSKTFTKDEYTKIKEDLEKKGLTSLLNSFVQRGTNFVFTGNLKQLNSGVLGDTSLENVSDEYKEAKKEAKEKGKAYNDLSDKKIVKVNQKNIWETPKSANKDRGSWYSTKSPSDLSSKYNVKFNISAGNTEEYLNSLLYKTDESGKFNTTKNGQYILDETKIYDILSEASINEEFAKSLPKQFFDTVKTIYKQKGLNLEGINAVSNNDASAVSSIVNILKEQDNTSSNFNKAQWGIQEEESYNYLKQYFDKKLISKEQLNQWSKLNPDEIEGKIKQIDPNANVKELKSKLAETEKTQFTGETSARKIANAEVITNEGLTAQKENINALIQSYDNYEEKVKEIQKLHNLSEDDAKKYLAVYIEQQDGITGITEVMSNYQSIFSKNNMEAKKGTAAYSKALQELKQQAQKTFGDNITTEWVENNIEDLRKLAGGGEEADAALERLKNTTEAAYGTITVNKADPNGKKATEVWDAIAKSINDAQKNIKKNAGNISKTISSVQENLNKLDNDKSISLDVKDNTRSAIAEALKNYLAMAGKYYAADDTSKSGILSDINNLISFANKNGFGISGISVSEGTEVELPVPGTNGEATYKVTKQEPSLEYSEQAVTVKDKRSKSTKTVEVVSDSSGNGNNKVTDFDISSLQRQSTYNATYNILKQINYLEKERNKLVTQRSRMLEEQKRTENYDLQALRQNQAQQAANLQAQISANQSAVSAADSGAASIASMSSGFSYNSAMHSVQIDASAISSMTDDEYSKFQSLISIAESYASTAQSSADKIVTAKDNLYELSKAATITDDLQYNNLRKIEELERKREKHQTNMNRISRKLHLNEKEYTKEKNKQIQVLKNEIDVNKQIAKEKKAEVEELNRQTAKNGWGNHLYYNQSTGTVHYDVDWFKSQNLTTDEYSILQDIVSKMESASSTIQTAEDSVDTATDSIDELTEGIQDFKNNMQNFDKIKGIIDSTLSILEKEMTRLKRRTNTITSSQIRSNYEAAALERKNKRTILQEESNQAQKNIDEEILSDDLVKKYLTYDKNNQVFYIKQSEYDKIDDKTIKDSVDNFYSKAQEYAGIINQNKSTIMELEDEDYNALETWRQDALKFDEKVYNAVVKMREEEVTNLNNINTSIQNAAADLVSSIQKNIQKIRQDRQNDKTAKELQDMEAKLAYLQVDTSNANQKDILSTQKSLEDKQQSYTDSLIDQKITELQQQNDEAAKQRKKQIDIMEAQLQLDKKNEVLWDYVYKVEREGLDSSGRIKKDSELYTLLSNIDSVNEKNAMQLQDWLTEWNWNAASKKSYGTGSISITTGQTKKTATNTDSYIKKSSNIGSSSNQTVSSNFDIIFKAYKTGGLVDQTGLAWLDGTTSSPEMVLSAKDTQNFIQLKDILADLLIGKKQKNNTNGDLNFEINIQIDDISSDYDVDQLVNRIKQQITNEARYRNVNTINMIR